MSDYKSLTGKTNALMQRMSELGLLRELQPGDEYFPDEDDVIWNEAIEAAAARVDELDCDACADAIRELKRKPSIYPPRPD